MPTTSGVFTGTITASNGDNQDATQNFSITITDQDAATDTPTLPP
jgi:hypothetical protein